MLLLDVSTYLITVALAVVFGIGLGATFMFRRNKRALERAAAKRAVATFIRKEY